MKDCLFLITGIPSISEKQDQDTVIVITATVASSFTVLLSFIVFFVIGCIYTIRWRDHKHTNPQSDPMYDEIPPSAISDPQAQKKTFELKQNVAYGNIDTIKIML